MRSKSRTTGSWSGSRSRAGLLILLAVASAGALADGPDLHALIEEVFSVVRASDCDFVRNGKAHEAPEAEAHMRRKYEHFADEIDSLDRFIELAGTKSLMSGRAYTVRCPGEPERPTADWLREVGQRLEAGG